jgi:hypothetical protein
MSASAGGSCDETQVAPQQPQQREMRHHNPYANQAPRAPPPAPPPPPPPPQQQRQHDDDNEHNIEFDDLVAQWSTEDVLTIFFREGHRIALLPAVAQYLAMLLAAPPATTPHWADKALAQSMRDDLGARSTQQRKSHRTFSTHLATALSETLSRRRAERSWTWATALKNLCFHFCQCIGKWRMALPFATTRCGSRRSKPLSAERARRSHRSPEAMTPDIFERTLAAETRPQHRAALQLMYFASCGLRPCPGEGRSHAQRHAHCSNLPSRCQDARPVHGPKIQHHFAELAASVAQCNRITLTLI